MLNDYYSPWISSDLSSWTAVARPEFLVPMPKGTHIEQGRDNTGYIYLVESGQLMQTVLSQSGTERILMFLASGSLFNEMGLFESAFTFYAVDALVDSRLYRIPQDRFLHCLHQDNDLCLALIRQLTRKVAILAHQTSDLVFGNAYQRIAAELLYFVCNHGVPVPGGTMIDMDITQQFIAKRINTSRETVCKVMGKMTAAGILKKEQGRYVIRDEEALHRAVAALRDT